MSNVPLVQEYMSNKAIQVSEDDPITFVASMFERTHISGAPVVNAQGEYVGVITKTDLAGTKMIRVVAHNAGNLDALTAKYFMSTKKPLTIHKDAPLERAVAMMLEHRVHRLFVTDDSHQIVGVLSTFDVLKAIRQGNEGEAPSRPVHVPPPSLPVAEEEAREPVAVAPAPVPETPPSSPSERSGSRGGGDLRNELRSKEERDRELEKRIFSLISRKQEQIQQRGPQP